MRTTFGFNAFQSTGKAVSDFLAYTETWNQRANGLGVNGITRLERHQFWFNQQKVKEKNLGPAK